VGWGPMLLWIPLVAVFTYYSGSLFTEQRLLVPNARVFGDVGAAAYGTVGRMATYAVNYVMLAGFPIVSLLFATEALQNLMAGLINACSWQFALVAQAAFLLLGQLQSLHKVAMLSHVGNAGILLIFVGVTVGLLSEGRCPNTSTSWFSSKGLPSSIVGMMHVVYVFGGQFAFVEFMSSMAHPADFTLTVGLVAAVEVLAFWYMGALGYYMKGSSLTGLITSRLSPGSWEARLANVGVLLQVVIKGVISQNVLIHAIANMACSSSSSTCCCTGAGSSKASATASANSMAHSQGTASGGSPPVLAAAPAPSSLGDTLPKAAGALSRPRPAEGCSIGKWMLVSVFVSVYSYLLAMSIPFLEQVVALLVSVGYPLVALVLPCIFLMKLWAKEGCPIRRARRAWFGMLIGGSFIVTGLGLYSSIYELQGKVVEKATGWQCLGSIYDGSNAQQSGHCS